MYTSTKDVIVSMYDRVVCGGIVYVDDYMGFNGAREAINDFRVYRRIYEPMVRGLLILLPLTLFLSSS